MFEQLDQLKVRLGAARPLPAATMRSLHDDLLLRWTYHSNAIEGNTLTLLETKVVLEGITVGGKPLREHFEAINHSDAILYLEGIVQRAEPFSEWQIRNLHQLILKNIVDDNAGRYRNVNVLINGASHTPADHVQVGEHMRDFLMWYNSAPPAQLHPVERAAPVHADLVSIHPFVDCNGRTSAPTDEPGSDEKRLSAVCDHCRPAAGLLHSTGQAAHHWRLQRFHSAGGR